MILDYNTQYIIVTNKEFTYMSGVQTIFLPVRQERFFGEIEIQIDKFNYMG